MNSLLWRASLRFYLLHPWQLLLAVLGVTLGVGVFVGVDLANGSALRAFSLTSDFIQGSTTHRILPVGDALPEDLYRTLVVDLGVEATPIVEAQVSIEGTGTGFTLLGIEPLHAGRFRSGLTAQLAAPDAFTRLLTEPDTILVPDNLARSDGDDSLTLRIDDSRRTVRATIAGTLPADATGGATLLADISTAQELTGSTGRLSRIDAMLTRPQVATLSSALPDDAVLVKAGTETATFDQLSRAFNTNIQALGLLALVVGMFMIYSTVSFAVVRRRTMLGVLRALGLTRGGLARMLFAETALLAIVGTALGIALGEFLSRALLSMVTATIGDFAFGAAVRATEASPWLYAKGAFLGVGTTIAAALAPLFAATRVDPAATMSRSRLEAGTRRAMGTAWRTALGLGIIGVALLTIGTAHLWIAFAAVFLMLLAAAFATPTAVSFLTRVAEPLLSAVLRSTGQLAARNASTHQSRIAVASAALALAVAAVTGIGLMVSSFRDSLDVWLGTTLTADIYLTSSEGELSEATIAAALGDPEVASVSTTRIVTLPTDLGTVRLRAFTPSARGWGLDVVDGDATDVQRLLESGTHVAVAEPFAYRNSLTRGTTISLPTMDGPRSFEIAAIYRDYNTAGAGVLIAGNAYRRYWGDSALSGIGLDLKPRADAAAVAARLTLSAGRAVRAVTTEGIKSISQTVFDRTFRITEVLRLLAAIVAFLGIVSALMSIQLEREHEFDVLRAIGFSPQRLAALIMTETTLVGTAAGIAALPTGIGLAALLVYVINRRSFGWSMELTWHAGPIAGGILLALTAAMLAGIFPSFSRMRRSSARAHRNEA
jgi:putative ABC transport system permease protein